MRPANIVTAVADILAGNAIALSLSFHASDVAPVILLVCSTALLYGGGVVLNDVFDAELDRIERPERPIPSGLIKESEAQTLGTLMLIAGVVAAFFVNIYAAVIAMAIAVAAVIYNKWNKHHAFLGPLNMGVCRGLNLLLGMTIFYQAIQFYWFVSLFPVAYIFAITMISRGEVHGAKKTTLFVAAGLYTLVIAAILIIAFITGYLIQTLPFIIFFAYMIFMPLQKAIDKPEGPRIGKAVKSGVIALIIMDAAWAASFGNWLLAVIILALLPLSLLLARLFAVT